MAGLDMRKMKSRTNDALAGFTMGQRAMMVVATVVVVVGLMLFSRTQGGPSMAALYSNLEATDASSITAKLDSAGISYRLADGGATIMVPASEVYTQRLKMSAQGLPAGGAASFALLDKQGITTSQFRQRVDYQRALGGELGRTVAAMDGVSAAVVNLVIPTNDVFATDSQKSTASILLKTTGTTAMDDGKVRAIVNLVASAVPDLSADSISVTDQAGNQLWYPGKQAEDTGGASTVLQRTREFQDSMAADLQHMIESIAGVGKVKVTVSADMDFDQQEQSQTRWNQGGKDGAAIVAATDRQTEQYAGSGVLSGLVGVDGQPSVVNGTPTGTATTPTTVAGATQSPAYANVKDTTQFAVDKVDTVIKTAPGKINRLGISVALDDQAVNDSVKSQIESLLTPFTDAQRGDVLSVERIPFSVPVVSEATKQLDAAATAQTSGGLMGMLKLIGTLLIVLLSLFFAWRSIKRAGKGDLTSTIDLRELEAVREELRSITEPAYASVGGGEAGSDRMLPSAADHDPYSLEPIPVSRAAAMASQMEVEIVDLVDRQPDEVALLLRNWLAERRVVKRR